MKHTLPGIEKVLKSYVDKLFQIDVETDSEFNAAVKKAKELTQYPQYCKFLTNASTFYWRKVRGANRQSAHSYGIAIDINTKYSNYWL